MQPWPILLASDDTMKILAVALGGFGLVYIVVLRPMLKKKKDPLDRPMPSQALSRQRLVEREMQNLLVEYEQMMRNMSAHLETRSAKLELLIREAEEKIAELRTAAQNASSFLPPADPYRNIPAEMPPAMPATAPIFDSAPAKPVESQADSRHSAIYALADQGLTAKAIARKLGQPDGEVELILALRSGIE